MSTWYERETKNLHVPFYKRMFNKVAEPRVNRILQLVTYLWVFWAGILVATNKPERILQVLGSNYATLFGAFLIASALIAGVAVLPGVWWLERVGIILLFTCTLVYGVIIAYTNATPVAYAFTVGFAISLVQRWIDIRGAQLAPRED